MRTDLTGLTSALRHRWGFEKRERERDSTNRELCRPGCEGRGAKRLVWLERRGIYRGKRCGKVEESQIVEL